MKTSDANKIFQIASNPMAILAFIFILHITLSFSVGMGFDEGMWHYMGWLWSEKGIPPYIGAVENKMPGIFMLFGISAKLFGVNIWFPRILGVFSITASSWFIYLIGRDLYDAVCGVFAMLFFGLTMAWHLMNGIYPAQTETFMVLFSILAFYAILKSKKADRYYSYLVQIFASGLFMGLAIVFKQIAVFSALALFLFYLSVGRASPSYRNLLYDLPILFLGILTSIVISSVPLFLSGVTIEEYWKGAWLILSQVGYKDDRIVSFNLVWGRSIIKLFYPLIILFVMQKKELVEKGVPFVGLILWMLLDFVGVNVTGHYLGHQFKEIVPVFALVSGISLSSLLHRFFTAAPQKRLTYAAAILVIAAGWMPLEPLRVLFRPPNYMYGYGEHSREVGEWIKGHTTAKDYVYVFQSDGVIQAYSERVSPTRYFNTVFHEVPGAMEEIVNALLSKRPRLIVLPIGTINSELVKSKMDPIRTMIMTSYRHPNTVFGYDVFERKGL